MSNSGTSSSRYATLALLGMLAISVFPCGCRQGDLSRSNGEAASSAEAFRVLSTIPAPDAIAVDPRASVQVSLSKDVDPSSVSAGSFLVSGETAGAIAGTYQLAGSGTRILFSSEVGLPAGERISVRLTDSIRSRSGAALEPFEFSFTTKGESEAPEEPRALRVVAVFPAVPATEVQPDTEVSVVWSEPVDVASVSASSAWLSSRRAGKIDAVQTIDSSGTVLVLKPQKRLLGGDRITLHLSREIRSASGAPFAGFAYTFSVRTAVPEGPYRLKKVYSAVGNVTHIATGDLNGDDLTDVVYASDAGRFLDILAAGAVDAFDLGLRIEVGQEVLALVLGDADADGDLDILVGTPDRARLYTNLLRELGGPRPTLRFEKGPEAVPLSPVRAIEIADLDHAGEPDVILATQAGIEIRLGGIHSPPTEVLSQQGLWKAGVIARDVDLDGWLDLVFSDPAHRGLRLCLASPASDLSLPPKWFAAPALVELGIVPAQIEVSDLQADALPDIVVWNGASTAPPVRVLFQTTTGFAEYPRLRVSSDGAGGSSEGREGVLVLDLDADGYEDIVAAHPSDRRVVWYRNEAGYLDLEGPGELLLELPSPTFVLPVWLPEGGGAGALAAGGPELHVLLPERGQGAGPPAGTFALSVDPAQVRQGARNATALVRMTNAEPVQGYTAVLGYDPAAISPTGVSLEGTSTGAAAAEFSDFRILGSGRALAYSILVDAIPPFEDRTIPAGENEPLFRLVFDVPETAPVGTTEIRFVDEPGPPPFANTLVVAAWSVTPEVSAGTIEVLPKDEPELPGEGNLMALGSATLARGARGELALSARSTDPLDAFTTVMTFDGDQIAVEEFSLEATATGLAGAELVIPDISPQAGYAVLTVILDFLPPFDRQKIPAGDNLTLARVSVRVQASATAGDHPVTLTNGVGPSRLENIFVVSGFTVYPALSHGKVVVEGGSGTRTFVRGDADGTSGVNLSDAVFILNHLFRGGTQPQCMDAADADDDGAVRLTDAVYILEHLFRSGPNPPPPYPEPGTDPTPDGLGC